MNRRVKRNYIVNFRNITTDLKDFAKLNEILIKSLDIAKDSKAFIIAI